MALAQRRVIFHFDGRVSWVRHWDIRFRVAAGALMSASVLAFPALSLIPLAALTFGLLAAAKATTAEMLAVLRGFSGFLVFFFVLGMAFEFTAEQAIFLAVQATRLILLLLLGQFLYLSATPADVTDGIRWYLGWLGRRRAWAASNMATWALASVPQVLDQSSGLMEAASLRGLQVQRFPVKTVKLLTLSLLIRTVGQSLDQAAALEARGFGQHVPSLKLTARVRDAAVLALLAVSVALSWLFGAIVT